MLIKIRTKKTFVSAAVSSSKISIERIRLSLISELSNIGIKAELDDTSKINILQGNYRTLKSYDENRGLFSLFRNGSIVINIGGDGRFYFLIELWVEASELVPFIAIYLAGLLLILSQKNPVIPIIVFTMLKLCVGFLIYYLNSKNVFGWFSKTFERLNIQVVQEP